MYNTTELIEMMDAYAALAEEARKEWMDAASNKSECAALRERYESHCRAMFHAYKAMRAAEAEATR